MVADNQLSGACYIDRGPVIIHCIPIAGTCWTCKCRGAASFCTRGVLFIFVPHLEGRLPSAFMGKTLIPKPHHTRRQIFTITGSFLLCCGRGGLRFGFGERLRVVHCKMCQHHFLRCCSCAALVAMRGSDECVALLRCATRINKQLVVNQHAVCIICACAR